MEPERQFYKSGKTASKDFQQNYPNLEMNLFGLVFY